MMDAYLEEKLAKAKSDLRELLHKQFEVHGEEIVRYSILNMDTWELADMMELSGIDPDEIPMDGSKEDRVLWCIDKLVEWAK